MPEQALPLAQKAAQLFAERGIENSRLEAELLLAHVLGIKRLELYLQFDRPLETGQLETFRALVRRRLKREPLQYITGRAAFRHLDLAVDPRVLIPRPETEVLVGAVLQHIAGRPARVLDVGTGSGAIAISIAKEAPGTRVFATDVSADAAALARDNAAANGANITVLTGSLYEAVPAGEQFDVIVSNPPYIAAAERTAMQPEVAEWEPEGALFAGADGLAVLRPLIAEAPRHLEAGGLIALEIGSTQAAEVCALLEATSSFETLRVARDLGDRERIVTAVCRRQA